MWMKMMVTYFEVPRCRLARKYSNPDTGPGKRLEIGICQLQADVLIIQYRRLAT
jgi:hypothetical protein